MITTTEIFKKNLESVNKLINFDKDVINMAIENVKQLHKKLTNAPHNIENDMIYGGRTLTLLSGIRDNKSLKVRYATINNQAVVLLVSYFSSAIADLFRSAAKISIEVHRDSRVLKSELKIKIEELIDLNSSLGDAMGDAIGDILISKNSISFQDMKSIKREFEKHFGIEINKDENVNNIILGQACRHTIAHEAGIVNSRVINQVKAAAPRSLKPILNEGSSIEFEESELEILGESMLIYVSSLEDQVEQYRKNK